MKQPKLKIGQKYRVIKDCMLPEFNGKIVNVSFMEGQYRFYDDKTKRFYDLKQDELQIIAPKKKLKSNKVKKYKNRISIKKLDDRYLIKIYDEDLRKTIILESEEIQKLYKNLNNLGFNSYKQPKREECKHPIIYGETNFKKEVNRICQICRKHLLDVIIEQPKYIKFEEIEPIEINNYLIPAPHRYLEHRINQLIRNQKKIIDYINSNQ